MLSRLVITFLPRSKRLLISLLQSPSAVILEPPKIKSATVYTSVCHGVMGLDAVILVFWMLSFKPTFSLSSFPFIKRLFSSSLSPRVCSDSCPLNQLMPSNHRILHRLLPLLPSTVPILGSFLMSWLFSSDGQSIGASASVLPVNIQDWFPLGLTALISLLSKGLLRVFSNTTIWKHQFFGTQPSLWSSSHIHTWLLEKPWLWLDGPLSAK